MEMLWVVLTQLAAAGSGPWVPGSGRSTLYLGMEGQRFTSLRGISDGEAEAFEVGEGIASVRAVADLSYGIGPRAEIGFVVPAQYAESLRDDAPICEVLGADACSATTTLGVIEAHAKGLIADQVSGAPFSLALGGIVRFGGFTTATRSRLTNAGEGALDVGPRLALGRTGAIGKGYYTTNLDMAWFYRFPNTDAYPNLEGDERVPGTEGFALFDALWSPIQTVSFGPSASFAVRPEGRDFYDLDFGDPDRFAALRFAQLRVGGKLILRDNTGNAFVFSVQRTAWAWNNPSDVLAVGVGVSLFNPLARRGG